MEQTAIDLIQEAIAEGSDDDDIKSIIISELVQKFGGVWFASVTPKPEEHGTMPSRSFLWLKIDKYGISILRNQPFY